MIAELIVKIWPSALSNLKTPLPQILFGRKCMRYRTSELARMTSTIKGISFSIVMDKTLDPDLIQVICQSQITNDQCPPHGLVHEAMKHTHTHTHRHTHRTKKELGKRKEKKVCECLCVLEKTASRRYVCVCMSVCVGD